MPQNKYRIYELSARSVMSYATQESGQWHFALDRAATEKCRSFSALHEQDGNAFAPEGICIPHQIRFRKRRFSHLLR